MFSRLRHWSQHVLTRLPSVLPSACALCGHNNARAICEGCRAQVFQPSARRCRRCALPLSDDSGAAEVVCGACLKKPPSFDATVVAADYAAPLDRLALALKFGGRLELAPLLADMIRDTLLRNREFALPSRLTAVPLGSHRLIERGFNQALEIAKPLSRSLGIPVDARLLVRQRETRAQSLLHPDERHANMRHAFLVPADAIERVRGQHLGVIDDVMTTGETLDEVAATLKRFGATRVTNFVFARTLQR
jgi:ComF family protein